MTPARVIVGGALVGLAVLTVVLFLGALSAAVPGQIIGFQRTGDDRKIVVIIQTSLLAEIAERSVIEDERSVRVTVRVRPPSGSVPSIAIVLPVLVSLRAPLAERIVLDQDGRTVQDRGRYELPGQRPAP